MRKETLLTIAAAITAIANEIASSAGVPHPETPEQEATPETPTPRRGRPAKTEKPAETPETPAVGKTYEELRELIEPLVKDGRGDEVKKLIAKHGAAILKELDPKVHAAFEKDIQALVL